MPRRPVRAFIAALLLATSPQAQTLAANAAAPAPTVRIDNFTFTPAEVTVPAGTAVTWVNGDDIPHTVAASDNSFRSKVMDTDQQYSFTFTNPGTYEYFCALHPHMHGKVIVK
jgi:amicyanin